MAWAWGRPREKKKQESLITGRKHGERHTKKTGREQKTGRGGRINERQKQRKG